MGQGAVVLLITDGLDRDDPDRLAREMERLHLSARRVIWLNPLLRWDGFSPKARGIRAILPPRRRLPHLPQPRLARGPRDRPERRGRHRRSRPDQATGGRLTAIWPKRT